MAKDICKKCGQEIRDGELVTGQSWNGQGGDHISCPEPQPKALAEVSYVPVDSSTGVYEIKA